MAAPPFPSHIQAILSELEAWGLENDSVQTDRSRKMLNLERETAEMVSKLIISREAKRILEIGTSNGYSTIWLAASVAALQSGSEDDAPGEGRVVSIERNPEKQRLAKENLEHAGLLASTELLLGDATQIAGSISGTFDAIFFDADRISAPAQLALLLPKLAPDALLLADNALSHPEEIAGYLAAVEALPDFEHSVIPVGKGLSVAYRLA